MTTARVRFTDRHGVSRTVECFARAVPRVLGCVHQTGGVVRALGIVPDTTPDYGLGDVVIRDGAPWRVVLVTEDGHRFAPVDD